MPNVIAIYLKRLPNHFVFFQNTFFKDKCAQFGRTFYLYAIFVSFLLTISVFSKKVPEYKKQKEIC